MVNCRNRTFQRNDLTIIRRNFRVIFQDNHHKKAGSNSELKPANDTARPLINCLYYIFESIQAFCQNRARTADINADKPVSGFSVS